MGVEQWGNSASTPSLMKLLAIRLGWHTTPTKSLVIALPLQRGGLAMGLDAVTLFYGTVNYGNTKQVRSPSSSDLARGYRA